jgi:hypothetical protein
LETENTERENEGESGKISSKLSLSYMGKGGKKNRSFGGCGDKGKIILRGNEYLKCKLNVREKIVKSDL